jgi:DNA gyrase/topoisomerase IV subunit B
MKALGLQERQKFSSAEDVRSLRYGKLMIMTDQDEVE